MSPLTKDTAQLPHQVADSTARQPGPSGKQAFHGGPLCIEVPVRVQGSQVILHGTTEHPEFFEEDTSTLILFPQGAVIRLAAGVKPGQKLALTNQKTSEDVLCRVVNVRNYPKVKGYVEIEFTRAAPTFWGVNFPAKAAPPVRAAAPVSTPAGQLVAPVPMAAPKARHASVGSAPIAPAPTDNKWDNASASATPVSAYVQQRGASVEPASPAGPVASSIAIEPRPAGNIAYDASAAARANEDTKPAAASKPTALAGDTNIAAIAAPHVADPPAAAVEWRVKEPMIDWDLAVPPHSEKGSASSPALLVSPDARLGAPVAHATQTIAAVEPAAKMGAGSAVEAIPPVPGATHGGEDDSREEAPPLSSDTWELNIPASSSWSTEAARLAATQPEPEKQPMAPSSSVAAAARERMAGVAARSSQDLHNPLGRFEQEAALNAHSSDSEDHGMSLGGQNLAMRSLRYQRPRSKLVLMFAYAAVFLSIVAGGAILFRRQFESSATTAAVPNAVTPSAPSPSTDAPQPQTGNDATQTQPIVNPELSRHDQRSASSPTGALEEAKEPASVARLPVTSNKPKVAPVKPRSIAAPPEQAAEATATALPKSTFQAVSLEAVASKPVARLTTPEKRAEPADAPALFGGVPGSVPGAQPSSAMGGISSEGASANVAPGPPPAPEAPRTALRVSGEVKAPRLLHSVQPRYPVVAEENHIEGDVIVQVDVDAAGNVAKASAVSGPVMLRQAAVDALRKWRYKPSTVNGEPVPVQLLVTVKFQLPK